MAFQVGSLFLYLVAAMALLNDLVNLNLSDTMEKIITEYILSLSQKGSPLLLCHNSSSPVPPCDGKWGITWSLTTFLGGHRL